MHNLYSLYALLYMYKHIEHVKQCVGSFSMWRCMGTKPARGGSTDLLCCHWAQCYWSSKNWHIPLRRRRDPLCLIAIYMRCKKCTISVACLCVQRRGGTPVFRVEGEDHTGVFGSHGEDWHTRRRILTPAFSAHKMKLVRVNIYLTWPGDIYIILIQVSNYVYWYFCV